MALKKADRYSAERKEILNRLLLLLGISEENNCFILSEFNSNDVLHKEILSLVPEIKKYFNCSNWSSMGSANVKNKPLSIVRSVLKDMGYSVFYKQKNILTGNKKYEVIIIYYVVKEEGLKMI